MAGLLLSFHVSEQMTPRRILIYGVTGSGKTTLAERLSVESGIPWQEVDQLTYGANWTQVPLEVQRQRIAEICEQDAWILDSAYATWVDIPLKTVELIVALDYPRWISLTRLFKRTFQQWLFRQPHCNGNIDTLKHLFSNESIIVWHFKSFSRKRSRIRKWESEMGDKVLRLTHPKKAEEFLAESLCGGKIARHPEEPRDRVRS